MEFVLLGLIVLSFPIVAIVALVKAVGLDDRMRRLELRFAEIDARIAALKEKPVSYLWRIRDQIRDLESMKERLKSMLPDKPMNYTVREIPDRRDCLWYISEYDFIYGDPAQWPKIYRANKGVIDGAYNRYVNRVEEPKYSRSEDSIFPGQEFDIPR